jgi:site-specific DNA-methyltransferase (adenine-specific)
VNPYYQDDAVTIYHGDCRDVLPGLTADSVFADPPYGAGKAGWDDAVPDGWIHLLPAVAPVAAITPGQRNVLSLPPRIGDLFYRWTLAPVIANATVRGDLGFGNWIPVLLYTREGVSLYGPRQDTKTFSIRGVMPDHPSPKPIGVMRWVLSCLPGASVVDPFCGSGSTLRAAKDIGRRAIGIEIEERYCEIAARRCAQEVLDLGVYTRPEAA